MWYTSISRKTRLSNWSGNWLYKEWLYICFIYNIMFSNSKFSSNEKTGLYHVILYESKSLTKKKIASLETRSFWSVNVNIGILKKLLKRVMKAVNFIYIVIKSYAKNAHIICIKYVRKVWLPCKYYIYVNFFVIS